MKIKNHAYFQERVKEHKKTFPSMQRLPMTATWAHQQTRARHWVQIWDLKINRCIFQYIKGNIIFLLRNDRSDFVFAYFASNLPSTVNTAKFDSLALSGPPCIYEGVNEGSSMSMTSVLMLRIILIGYWKMARNIQLQCAEAKGGKILKVP